jgi:hypothetical protein
MKKLLIIGPGSSIKNFTLTRDDYTILSFAGTFDWFKINNHPPDYWTFFDPNSAVIFLENLKLLKPLNSSINTPLPTTLIYNDFQGKRDFYNLGFTTTRGFRWNINQFNIEILPELSKYFKEVIKIPSTININSLNTNPSTHNIITHGKGVNFCKFSSNVLPLIYYYFPNFKHIDVVGFGDYSSPRAYQSSSLGYDGFKSSFDLMFSHHKKYLEDNKINIKFLNNNSYYKKLEWKK